MSSASQSNPTKGFVLESTCPKTAARAGVLHTSHGPVPTPAFMPVATQATVKALLPNEVQALGATILLSNAYHLTLQPGGETIEQRGGLHAFMAWPGALLTDSGGFQVFSLAELRELQDEGVWFRSHRDAERVFLSPEKSVDIQEHLGADVMMALDVCPHYAQDASALRRAQTLTQQWALRCLQARRDDTRMIFGIVQGGFTPEGKRSAGEWLAAQPFDGFAIGGLSVGEPKALTWELTGAAVEPLPRNKPRYLMGLGSPEDLLEGIARGIDIFDCALPTRVARNGALLTRQGRINLRNARHATKDRTPETGCDCWTCRTFSRAYLHYLFRTSQMLGCTLATIHNLRFVLRLMEQAREAIMNRSFPSFWREFSDSYQTTDEKARLQQKARMLATRGG